MPRIANETTERKEIEITEEMVEAAAEVLRDDPGLDLIMTGGWATDLATRMLERALGQGSSLVGDLPRQAWKGGDDHG
jgi:hypothetical protein